jgi:hypothetical protein
MRRFGSCVHASLLLPVVLFLASSLNAQILKPSASCPSRARWLEPPPQARKDFRSTPREQSLRAASPAPSHPCC